MIKVTEIKFKISDKIPAEIMKFIIERELDLKISKIEHIKEEIQSLPLTQEDINLFEKARQAAWNDLKRKQKL